MRPGLVHDYMRDSAARAPGAPALFDGRTALAYGELRDSAARLARLLRDLGVAEKDRVVLVMRRSAETIVAMHGVLEAGATYVPLDVKSPAERWRAVFGDCRPTAVVCDTANAGVLGKVLGERIGEVAVVVVDGDDVVPGARRAAGRSEWNGTPARPVAARIAPDDPAYVLYTSGSTGAPKGVVISHRNIRAYIDWAVDCFEMSGDDVVLGTAPFHFDMSVFDIYATMAATAKLSIASDGQMLFPTKLVEFVETEGVTVWKGVSSLLMYMARAGVLQPDRMPSLRTVLFGGETFAARYLKQWMEAYPDKVYCNAYGPTEATGISLYHVVPAAAADATERVPIGVPCRDTEAVLLDGEGNAVAPGEVGELCLGGPCLSSGYLGDPEKNARAFIPAWSQGDEPPRRLYRTGDLARLDERGVYLFVGRLDDQVKIMGYRVELGEIEHALLSLEPVRDGAVILAEDEGTGLGELVAFVESDVELDAPSLLSQLGSMLPQYMVPKRIVRLDRLPRGDRGKVDRRALAGAC